MYGYRLTSCLIATTTLLSRTSAGILPRQELKSWVSVNSIGAPVSTVTPILTSVNGIPTTISAAPASTTATVTDESNTQATATPGVMPTLTGGGSFEVCFNLDGQYAPFCKPDNGSDVYVGETYYVTWDTRFLPVKNTSVLVQANYVNTTGGVQAFQSPPTTNAFGFYAWTIDKEWLKGKGSNNITLYIVPLNPIANEPTSFTGPVLRVTNRPPDYYRQPLAKAPKGESLYIALPSVFGFIVLCLVGGFFWNRHTRKIGLGNVMGRRGYGFNKSRTQRLGLSKKSGAIKLRDQELRTGPQYTDHPERGVPRARADSVELGSLAGTPTEERRSHFSEEIDRQQTDKR